MRVDIAEEVARINAEDAKKAKIRGKTPAAYDGEKLVACVRCSRILKVGKTDTTGGKWCVKCSSFVLGEWSKIYRSTDDK